MSRLRRLYLHENLLIGTIPTEIGQLTLLRKLDCIIFFLLFDMPRLFTFPAFDGLLGEARFDNSQLQGTMPFQVCNLFQYGLFDLRANCALCKDRCCTQCY